MKRFRIRSGAEQVTRWSRMRQAEQVTTRRRWRATDTEKRPAGSILDTIKYPSRAAAEYAAGIVEAAGDRALTLRELWQLGICSNDVLQYGDEELDWVPPTKPKRARKAAP